MAWRFVPCFVAAIVAVGLSSGSLSSAEKERKKDGGVDSRLERVKRSILWKQEVFVSDEKDSTSSEKLAKHRRCKRDDRSRSGSACSSRRGDDQGVRSRLGPARPWPRTSTCNGITYHITEGHRRGLSTVRFDLRDESKRRWGKGKNYGTSADRVWEPYPEKNGDVQLWPKKFAAKLYMTGLSGQVTERLRSEFDLERRLGTKQTFPFSPFYDNFENENRYIYFRNVPNKLIEKGITLKIFDAKRWFGYEKLLCQLKVRASSKK